MNNETGFKPRIIVFNGKRDCLRALEERVRHAKTDEEIYKIFCIRIEILMLYGKGLEALPLLEGCIGYYKSVGNTEKATELLKLKKSIIDIKGAK